MIAAKNRGGHGAPTENPIIPTDGMVSLESDWTSAYIPGA